MVAPQVPCRDLTVFSRFVNGMYDFGNLGFLERFCGWGIKHKWRDHKFHVDTRQSLADLLMECMIL